ncbi:hypothetical protein JTB14_030821 [Gonioctena quinquepunctata]|nr:hypothetical protein JTB14_030821 [Gonioctena quinquepunctata]
MSPSLEQDVLLKGSMGVKVETAFNIIIATAILHNLAIEENEDIPEEWLNEEYNDIDLAPQHDDNIHLGRNVRQFLILNH